MTFFKKRSTALILAVLTVFFSTGISVKSKLQEKCDEVSELVYVGVKYDGYKHPDILTQLVTACDVMDNFVYFIPDGIDGSSLAESSEDLRLAIKYNRDDASYLHWCYSSCLKEFNAVCAQMKNVELNESQQRALETYSNEIDGVKKVIAESGYNDAVREFMNNELNGLAEFFAAFFGVNTPEYFE